MPISKSCILMSVVVACLFTRPILSVENSWPDYRGPEGTGHATAKNVPLKWNEKTNVKWKTAVPGKAWSSPVVYGKQVWFSNAPADGKKRYAICLDLETGSKLYDILLFETPKPTPWSYAGNAQSHASPTPVIEAGRVYVHFGRYGTACIDTSNGKVLWKRTDIDVDHREGAGASPILWKNLLILSMDGADKQFGIALNTADGKTVWKTERSIKFGDTIAERRKSFSTPILVGAKKDQLIIPAALAVYGYDAATGREIWRADYHNKGFSIAPRPVVSDDHVFIITGYLKAELLAVKLGGKGNVTESHITWRDFRTLPFVSSPIVVGKHLYMVDDGGILTCRIAATGKTIWRERLSANFQASPVYAAGRLYFFDQEGTTHVVAPGEKFKLLAENKLAEGCIASAAVIEGSLILRTPTHVYRIQE